MTEDYVQNNHEDGTSASMFYHIYSTVHEKDFLKTNKPMADYSEYTAILQLQ